jgi:hypothetical protein
MALTLNGSTNTITGLAVGGLPDGCVDTDTLADLAVSTDKIVDGAATQAKRTYAAGEIIQTVQFTKTSQQAISSSTTWTSVLTDTAITPKFSNSLIIITAWMRFQEAASGASHFRGRIYDVTNSSVVAGGGDYLNYINGISNTIGMIPLLGTVSASNTNARSYNIQVYEESGGELYIGPNDYTTGMLIQELKQ